MKQQKLGDQELLVVSELGLGLYGDVRVLRHSRDRVEEIATIHRALRTRRDVARHG